MDRGKSLGYRPPSGVPHTRGDGPDRPAGRIGLWVVFPTHVGMDRSGRSPPRFVRPCSPHTWGWTGNGGHDQLPPRVFPTHVGMDREDQLVGLLAECVPHTRGDGPTTHSPSGPTGACSPHTWGWTVASNSLVISSTVFPTHVGMDRAHRCRRLGHWRVPHTRGDGPYMPLAVSIAGKCSPHTWGWTVKSRRVPRPCAVFPTHVGMDRLHARHNHLTQGVPHTRGDGPCWTGEGTLGRECSPHTWGWTGEHR